MPDPLVCTALDVGGGSYLMAAAVGDAMLKDKGATLRVIPSGTDIGRLSLVALKRAHFTWLGLPIHLAQEGVVDFATIDWGPQRLRILVAGLPAAGMLLATAKDANIKTWADLKGKRIADVKGAYAQTLIADCCLAFAGLTWDDAKRVYFPSFGTAGKGVVEGKADAAVCATFSSWVYELAASPRGLYFPPYPHADNEAWKRLRLKVPVMQKIFATVGPGLSKEKQLETGSYPNPAVTVYDWTDTELAYNLTKMLHELWPKYSIANVPGMEQLDPGRRWYDYVLPYHAGAIRYYKEIGVWKPEYDKNNDLQIKRQDVLTKAWEKALADAAEQKIAADKFPAFWEGIRVKALEAVGLDVYYRK